MPRVRSAARALALASLAFVCACGPGALINLGSVVPITTTPPGTIPLEIITHSVAIPDPLPIPFSRVRYAGLEEPLGHAVATATVPWADLHRRDREGGWQLLVELVQADIERTESRMTVTLGVRATLRARVGNVYLAQTQTHCREAALVEPAQASPLFYSCMMNIGRELAGWLGGVTP